MDAGIDQGTDRSLAAYPATLVGALPQTDACIAFKTLVEIRKVSTAAALVLSDRLGINFLAAFIVVICELPQPLEELKARSNVGL